MARALEILSADRPDLILADTELDDVDGFTFVQRLRQSSAWSHIPFMFLSSDGSIESKIRGLELGVQDYLTKPIYIREVVARVGIELSRSERDDLAARGGAGSKTRFSGSLSEMSVVDLLQTIDVSRKTGVLYLVSAAGERGAVFFDLGAVIHAHVGELKGDDAVYRLLLWSDGSFDLEFRPVREGQQTVQLSTQALLMEGMHRLDQWGRLHEQLPSTEVALEVDGDALRKSLQDLPDETNDLLRLVDGARTIEQVLEARGGDRLETLRALVDLYFEGIVCEVGSPLRSIAVVRGVQGFDPAILTGMGHDTIPGPGGAALADPYKGLDLAPPPPYNRNHKPTTVGFQFAAVPAARELGLRSAESPLPSSNPSPLNLGATTADAIPAAAASRKRGAGSSGAPSGRELDHTPLTVGAHQVDEAAWSDPSEGDEDEPVLRSSRPPTPLDRQQLVLHSNRPGPAIGDEPSDDWRLEGEPHEAQPAPNEGLEQLAAELEPVGAGQAAAAQAEAAQAGELAEPRTNDATEAAATGPVAALEGPEARDGLDPIGPAGESELPDEEDRETLELTPWDSTLSALREDPEVSAALDAIDSGRAAAPFLRSIPPARRDAAPFGAASRIEPVDLAVDDTWSESESESESGPGREPSRRPLLFAAFLLLGGAIVFSLLLRPTEPASQSEPEPLNEKLADEEEAAPRELAFEPERVLVQAQDAEPTQDAVEDPDEPLTAGDEAPAQKTAPERSGRAPDEQPQSPYEAQLELAREHERGKLAVSAYRRALEIDPEGAEALAELGFLMLQQGRNAEAAQLARKATQADPSSSLAWITLGSARQYLKDEDGAMSAYRNCVKHGRGPYVAECRAVLR